MTNSIEKIMAVADVFAAQKRCVDLIRNTPMIPSFSLSQATGRSILLKLETLQDTGAFKVRGAANRITQLSREQQKRGVIAYSTGNHGRAVAHVARLLGINSTICVSESVPENKLEGLRETGCTIEQQGVSQDEAAEHARALAEQHGFTLVDPVNDLEVMIGQATCGLEMVEAHPDLDSVIVPVSGGALAAGIAAVVKTLNPRCRVFGVSMERGAAMYESVKTGHPIQVPEAESLADSLQGGILLNNKFTFEMIQELLDEHFLVSEEQIARAMVRAFSKERLVLEGAGATPLAALVAHNRDEFGKKVGLVCTGNRVDVTLLSHLYDKYREDAK